MTVAFIGLGGVIFGAITALLGAALADRRSTRNEARRWRRDQLAAAYEQTLRAMLRAANRRSEFEDGTGGAILLREHQREWFDDLVEAQVGLRAAMRYTIAVPPQTVRGARRVFARPDSVATPEPVRDPPTSSCGGTNIGMR
jgi:hypothetical protein